MTYEIEIDRDGITVYQWRFASKIEPSNPVPVAILEITHRDDDGAAEDFLRAAVNALNEKAAFKRAKEVAGAFDAFARGGK